MRFFDAAKLKTVETQLARRMTDDILRESESIQQEFMVIPLYIGLFFKGIRNDSNTPELLKIFADQELQKLGTIAMFLTFWWFYSLDRFEAKNTLENVVVLEGLNNIFKISGKMVTEWKATLDGLDDNKIMTAPVTYISMATGKDIDYTAIMPKLLYAQVTTLKDPQKALTELM